MVGAVAFAQWSDVNGDVAVGENGAFEGEVLFLPSVRAEVGEADKVGGGVAGEACEQSAGDDAVFALVVYFVAVLRCVDMVENVFRCYVVGLFVCCHLRSRGCPRHRFLNVLTETGAIAALQRDRNA